MIKQLLKPVLDTAWALKSPMREHRALFYHSVHPTTVESHRPEDFAAQLQWLCENGYMSARVGDIVTRMSCEDVEKADQPWVAITFDDGYRDNLDYAVPILKNMGWTATFFVVTSMVGDDMRKRSEGGHRLYPGREMMNKRDLRCLVEEGMEVGSHTVSHQLATRLLDHRTLQDELEQSKDRLEQMISAPVVSFAYPNGQRGAFSKQTRQCLARAGYQTAVTTMWGHIKENDDPLQLPRCEMRADDSLAEFTAKMMGRRDYRSIYQRMFDRSVVWSQGESVHDNPSSEQ